jgi:UDP-3-O-[3-hydroxymyristoyl] glucosamine N-acyltransferase
MNKNLLILGAGQFGLMVKEIAESMGCFDRIEFLDDSKQIAIGKLMEYERFFDDYHDAIVAIGNPYVRLAYTQKLEDAGFRIASVVSPMAYVSPLANLMRGAVIEPMAVVQANSTISLGCIVSSGAVVRHDAVLSEGCHLDCGAVVMSGGVVPAMTKVNACEVYR